MTVHETVIIRHCWVSRLEAMGYEGIVDAAQRMTEAEFAAIDAWAEAQLDGQPCGHDQPLPEGSSACGNGYCVCRYDALEALCMRKAGHDGDHEFVRTRDILVTFPPLDSEEAAR